MGLDLYIEARIREKKTGRVISSGEYGEHASEEDKGFFEICWWGGWLFCDIRAKMIEICSQYLGTNYTDSDFAIPTPQAALREIYAYLIKRSCVPEDECFEMYSSDFEWQERGSYEKMNLANAEKLHDILWILNSIQYDNDVDIGKKYISDDTDRKFFKENPQAYKWEFRIFNSY